MFFLILESLGSTELAFILVMALVFFGPRKLPQLSRTLGKNLASFRRASEDFKRTWDKEVTLEELNLSRLDLEPSFTSGENSLLADNEGHQEGHQEAHQEAHQENSQPLPTATPTMAAVDTGSYSASTIQG